MKAGTRIEMGACMLAAAVAIAMLPAAGTILAASLPTPRMVPVDPLLDEVDAATGRMTFYSVGELGTAAESFEVSASMDGGAEVRAALGSDRRATVSFGAVAAGKHEIDIVLAPKTGGEEVCRNRYAITARAERAFSAEIEGGEVIPELSWDSAVPDAKAVAKARKAGQPPHCVTVTHRVVFRATTSAPTLTFMDWAGRTERGGAVGGRQLVNFVRVAPYYGGL